MRKKPYLVERRKRSNVPASLLVQVILGSQSCLVEKDSLRPPVILDVHRRIERVNIAAVLARKKTQKAK